MNENLRQNIEGFAALLGRITEWCGRIVSWLVISMVIVTFFVVVMRYLFDSGWIALQESVSYMHSFVFLVGAAYTLKHNEHVRVDIIYERLSGKARAWIELAGHIFMLIPVMVFIIWISYPYVESSWLIHESSQEAGGLAGVFIIKSLILVMAALLILQALALVAQAVLTILGSNNAGNDAGNKSGASI